MKKGLVGDDPGLGRQRFELQLALLGALVARSEYDNLVPVFGAPEVGMELSQAAGAKFKALVVLSVVTDPSPPSSSSSVLAKRSIVPVRLNPRAALSPPTRATR